MKTQVQQMEGGLLYRNEQVREVLDDESRIVELSFSSEFPVTRSSFFGEAWVEVLGHDAREVDLSRLKNGAPVLFNHDSRSRGAHIGVVESATIKDGKGTAKIRLSSRPEIDSIFTDIKDGILRNVSVGYQITERTLVKQNQDGPDEFRVTGWTPMEISLVTVPADPDVGVNRSEENTMMYRVLDVGSDDGTDNGTEEINLDNREVDEMTPIEIEAENKRIAEVATLAAHTRTTGIMEAFANFPTAEANTLRDACIMDSAITVEIASRKLLDLLGADTESAGHDVHIEAVAGGDAKDKFRTGAELMIAERAGILPKDQAPDMQNEFRGFTMVELARHSLRINNVDVAGLDKMSMVGRAFNATDDFPLILGNTAHKSLMIGYNETEETFHLWTKKGNLSDFKVWSRNTLSAFESLTIVPEGGEYSHASFSEFGEQIQLATYGKMFAITRQAIINDDLNAFADVPRAMGRAAIRTVADLPYAVLTNNAAMSDAVALFHASHSNLDSGGGAVLSEAVFGAMRNAMILQTDPSTNAKIGVRPRFVLGPVDKEDSHKKLLRSATDISQANPEVINVIQGQATVISDHRLDTDSVTRYYTVADPSSIETIEVAYLDGNDQPVLEQQGGWNIDGVEFKVRIDAAAKAMDWRGMQMNNGV
jgi:HK97 family phage prohead protease